MAKVGEVTVLGEELEVHATASKFGGSFSVKRGESTYGSGKNYEEAVEEAKKKVRRERVNVAVKFVIVSRRGAVTRGVARRKHVGNGDVLADLYDGSKDRIDYRGQREALRGDTPDEKIEALVRLQDEAKEKERAIAALRSEYGQDLGAAVDTATEEALAAVQTEGEAA